MSFASREQLLAPSRRRYGDMTLPVSRLRVRFQSLMAGEMDEYTSALYGKGGGMRKDRIADAKRRLIQMTLVGEDNALLLSEADVDALRQWDGADLSELYEEVYRHCGFAAGEVDAAVKNSETVRVEDSPSE